jgi:hypothetical protein
MSRLKLAAAAETTHILQWFLPTADCGLSRMNTVVAGARDASMQKDSGGLYA